MQTAEPDTRDMFRDAFSDPDAVARYADSAKRFIPGLEALRLMTALLIEERAGENAKILVLGAGGGLELAAMAERRPDWRFVGVDPAPEMLRLAERTLGPRAHQAELVEGYVEQAPDGPFDGAACLLTAHFMDAPERSRCMAEIRRRLKPGALFVVAHNTLPEDATGRDRALARYVAFANACGADPDLAERAKIAIGGSPSMLPAETDEAILRETGFSGVELFYAAFSWRGWVAYA